jgi:hypothetical protein
MNKENTETLFLEFPELYRGRTKPITDSTMSLGFLCGDGWFELLHQLSNDIMTVCRTEPIPVPEVMQVKEKFGLLRYYIRSRVVDGRIRHLIQRAESRSASVCEHCGAPGTLRHSQRCVATLCDQCEQRISMSH